MTRGEGAPRSLVRAAGIGAIAAFLVFLLLLTYGRPWDLLPRETLGNFYDAQAESFSHGHLTVDPAEVSFEGFLVDGRTYEYQGPVPALMRLPIVLVTDRFHGRLTRVSMLAAYAVSLWFLVRLLLMARRVVRDDDPVRPREPLWTGVMTFGLGASSLLFLASKAWVYHEALLWGVAFSLGAFLHLSEWLTHPRFCVRAPRPAAASARRNEHSWGPTGDEAAVAEVDEPPIAPEPWFGSLHLVLAAVFAGLALLTRSAVGAGPMAALLMCGGVQVVRWWLTRRWERDGAHGVSPRAGRARSRNRSTSELVAIVVEEHAARPRRVGLADRLSSAAGWRRTTTAGLAVLVLGVLVPVGIYAVVNEAKFGTLFSLPADKQVLVQHDPTRQEFFARNGNSLFGAKFVTSVALQAVRPDAVSLGGAFPFVAFPADRPEAVGDTLFAERDWSSSVTDSEPLLVLLGLLGLATLLAPRRLAPGGDVAALRLPVLAAAAGGAGFFAIGYMANRYMSDLFPLAALTSVVGFQALVARSSAWRAGARRLATIGIVGLALVGAWVNLGIGTEYQRVIAPGTSASERADWLRIQARLGPTPTAIRVGLLAPLPGHPALGAVAIVGDCDAVYRSNGAIWLPLEGGGRAGHFSGTMRFDAIPARPIAVLAAIGAAGRNGLVMEPVGGGQVRFVAVTTTQDGNETRSLPGPAVTLAPNQDLKVDITFDWRSGYAEVNVDGRQLLASNIALTPAVPGLPMGFPGAFRLDRASSGTCDALG